LEVSCIRAQDFETLGIIMTAMTNSENLNCEEAAEIMRKKNRYRELILSGRMILPHSRAAQLLGPDCLYHLYSISRKETAVKKRQRGSSK
jgi:hypothetical protein